MYLRLNPRGKQMNSLNETVDRDGLPDCPYHKGTPPILDTIHMRHGYGYVYRCPTCPPDVAGRKISYSKLEAKIEWRKRC